MSTVVPVAPDWLRIHPAVETERVAAAIRDLVLVRLRRKGVVVGLSGGIDSSVVAALCTRALGADGVIGLFTPEKESSGDSLRLGRMVAEHLKIKCFLEDVTSVLEAIGCYARRDESIRSVVPEYASGWKSKLVIPDFLNAGPYALFSIVVQSPTGARRTIRLPLDAYLGIVAATNFKQRTRKMVEYYYADRFHFAVAGTPNRLEYELGFFVKNGDGAADLKPIAHLYKSQVYQLAAYLGVPKEIQERPPTTDTYTLEQGQDEFYFSMPLTKMDLCLYGEDHGIPPEQIAPLVGFSAERVAGTYTAIEAKRRAAHYLHLPPAVVDSGS